MAYAEGALRSFGAGLPLDRSLTDEAYLAQRFSAKLQRVLVGDRQALKTSEHVKATKPARFGLVRSGSAPHSLRQLAARLPASQREDPATSNVVHLENQRLREQIRSMCETIKEQSSTLSQLWADGNLLQPSGPAQGCSWPEAQAGLPGRHGLAGASRMERQPHSQREQRSDVDVDVAAWAASDDFLYSSRLQQRSSSSSSLPARPQKSVPAPPLHQHPQASSAATQTTPRLNVSASDPALSASARASALLKAEAQPAVAAAVAAPGLAGTLGRYPSGSRLPLFNPSIRQRPGIRPPAERSASQSAATLPSQANASLGSARTPSSPSREANMHRLPERLAHTARDTQHRHSPKGHAAQSAAPGASGMHTHAARQARMEQMLREAVLSNRRAAESLANSVRSSPCRNVAGASTQGTVGRPTAPSPRSIPAANASWLAPGGPLAEATQKLQGSDEVMSYSIYQDSAQEQSSLESPLEVRGKFGENILLPVGLLQHGGVPSNADPLSQETSPDAPEALEEEGAGSCATPDVEMHEESAERDESSLCARKRLFRSTPPVSKKGVPVYASPLKGGARSRLGAEDAYGLKPATGNWQGDGRGSFGPMVLQGGFYDATDEMVSGIHIGPSLYDTGEPTSGTLMPSPIRHEEPERSELSKLLPLDLQDDLQSSGHERPPSLTPEGTRPDAPVRAPPAMTVTQPGVQTPHRAAVARKAAAKAEAARQCAEPRQKGPGPEAAAENSPLEDTPMAVLAAEMDRESSIQSEENLSFGETTPRQQSRRSSLRADKDAKDSRIHQGLTSLAAAVTEMHRKAQSRSEPTSTSQAPAGSEAARPEQNHAKRPEVDREESSRAAPKEVSTPPARGAKEESAIPSPGTADAVGSRPLARSGQQSSSESSEDESRSVPVQQTRVLPPPPPSGAASRTPVSIAKGSAKVASDSESESSSDEETLVKKQTPLAPSASGAPAAAPTQVAGALNAASDSESSGDDSVAAAPPPQRSLSAQQTAPTPVAPSATAQRPAVSTEVLSDSEDSDAASSSGSSDRRPSPKKQVTAPAAAATSHGKASPEPDVHTNVRTAPEATGPASNQLVSFGSESSRNSGPLSEDCAEEVEYYEECEEEELLEESEAESAASDSEDEDAVRPAHARAQPSSSAVRPMGGPSAAASQAGSAAAKRAVALSDSESSSAESVDRAAAKRQAMPKRMPAAAASSDESGDEGSSSGSDSDGPAPQRRAGSGAAGLPASSE
eukprot:TRINITY_DN82229_c0_g1_i1.p1 TRINITY_DN82229_c0_g1~~TRINITY_DN82229_c0_g1_i1.p1  ORF type:complete len:1239 (+),score=252.62 TRINITY_DN82229_c0_g1_i1:82-3798(+)